MPEKKSLSLPKTPGAVCRQWKRCGKPGCRCARGDLHGPYYCYFVRIGGRLRKRYLRAAEAAPLSAACAASRQQRRADRQSRRKLQEISAELRQLEQLINQHRQGASS